LLHQTWLRSRFAVITLTVLVLILYWTLYPFEFHPRTGMGPLRTLFSTFRTEGQRGDIVANVLLFLPLGLFLMQSLRRPPGWREVLAATAAGALLSCGIELLQFYDRSRQTTLSDVYSNTAGACLGAVAGVLSYGKVQLAAAERAGKGPLEILLLALWAAYRLYPFEFVIDVEKYWAAVRPALHLQPLPALELYRHFAVWLVIALLIEAAAGAPRSRWILACFGIPAMFAARILSAGTVLSPGEVAGAVLAAALWCGFLWRRRNRAVVIATLFTGLIVLDSFQPPGFQASGPSYDWVPFGIFVRGSASVGIFLEMAFLNAALPWVAIAAGCSWRVATLAGGTLVFALGLIQLYLNRRPAGVTELAILLIAAAFLRLLQPEDGPAREWRN
jgi:glycopeptide antibiotics resistance protein